MQILHLKTRIKRENSILTGHLTAVKVGVIYCSGGVTAVYRTTQVHPPVGELRELHSMQCVISVSSNWCFISWPSDHHVPSQSHLFTAPSWVQPGHHLSSAWEPAVLPRSPNTGWGHWWRLGWEAASPESEQWSDLATFLTPEVIYTATTTQQWSRSLVIRNFGWPPLKSCLVLHQYQVRRQVSRTFFARLNPVPIATIFSSYYDF